MPTRAIVFAGLGLLVLVNTVPGQSTKDAQPKASETSRTPRVFQYDGKALMQVKKRVEQKDAALTEAVKILTVDADKQLKVGPFTVMAKPATPPSKSKHAYMSLAPFWWPDPDKKDGLPYVRRDGETNPDSQKYDKPQLEQLAHSAHQLALAWYLTGDERYAEHAAKLIRGWFLDGDTAMIPHLEYAQFIPGRNEGRGAGIIDGIQLLPLIDAVGLLAGSKSWTDNDQTGMRSWFQKYLHWLQTNKAAQNERAAKNNHGTWFDAQLASCALFVDDNKTARDTLTTAKLQRIAAQLDPDGQQPRELARTKGLDYCRFNLEAFFALATLGKHVEVDLWSYRGDKFQSIRQALDWVSPFATGEKKWDHKQIVKPKTARFIPLFRRAAIAYGDDKYEKLLGKITGDEQSMVQLLLYMPAKKE